MKFLLSYKQRKSICDLLLIGFISSFILFQPLAVFACGMSMISSDSPSGWTYANDSAEQSYINYENGIEHLIISRNFENGSANTVWVIPVPSAPTSVNVDVLKGNPEFSGFDVVEKSRKKINDIKQSLLSTQIYPIALSIYLYDSKYSLGDFVGFDLLPKLLPKPHTLSAGDASGVEVYEHIEKNGMIAEVLSATDSDSLYEYLNAKGLKAEKDSISILQSYIGKNFSFVATWVSSAPDNIEAKGVLIKFPTDRIFYPLKPESGTPGNGFPETITVVGHVTPNLYENIMNSTSVDYLHSYRPSHLEGFFSSKDDFNFTKIVINTERSVKSIALSFSFSIYIGLLFAFALTSFFFIYISCKYFAFG